MRPSIKGGQLPETFEEFQQLCAAQVQTSAACFSCLSPFSAENTRTPAGWRETQISNMCENCYDKLFAEEDS